MLDFLIQGDVFCFTKLEEALMEVNFVIEAVHEDLEDKKSLLESKTIITQQFLKGQLISKGLFGILEFLQKTN